jgi:hypothetical protein
VNPKKVVINCFVVKWYLNEENSTITNAPTIISRGLTAFGDTGSYFPEIPQKPAPTRNR